MLAALIPGLLAEPLSPLGAKVQTVWRYCDFGWRVEDETKHNIDVTGLNWSPIGLPRSEFFDGFEIRVSHSPFLPDGGFSNGLLTSPSFFTENILGDPSDQVVVHQRGRGYRIDPNDLFAQPLTGTLLMAYPWNNVGGPEITYLWRDTSILDRAGPGGAGVPTFEEANANVLPPGQSQGDVASAGAVPTFGLPLLMEFRCYPTSTGVGLNLLDVGFSPILGSPVYSVGSFGSVNTSGNRITVNPDLATQPTTVGFFSYIGQLDTVIRVSRAHTIWIDTQNSQPTFMEPVVQPSPDDQPSGTEILIEYRGATGFSNAGNRPFDAASLDPYGEIREGLMGVVTFLGGAAGWTDDISAVDGAQYLQARFTFINNVDTERTADLSAIGFTFLNN